MSNHVIGANLEVVDDCGEGRIEAALTSRGRVKGLTHGHYRYPARFPPLFARAAIELFTRPGDLIVDPFVGGGTSAVEALALGRQFLGGDLNALAVFVTRAKTTLIGNSEAIQLMEWARSVQSDTPCALKRTDLAEPPDPRVPWPIRKALAFALERSKLLATSRLRTLARAALLRSGQWALDGRKEIPGQVEFSAKHRHITEEIAVGSVQLGTIAARAFAESRREVHRQRKIYHVPATRLAEKAAPWLGRSSPSLILTSPPYHGVHILYHRWQVQGRRETSTPYWLAGMQDGQQASYYTFGGRVRASGPAIREEYFERVCESFKALVPMCSPQTLMVQLVGFSDPGLQLPRYLDSMRSAGFDAVSPLEASHLQYTPLKRDVPNQKWYLDALRRTTASSQEFLLIHRLSR